ncbi:hypothetical protein FQR65_LT01909 [Abscondita terminalis]|nr:hypothetical protein FQR65_LT01909 [Abscondita terminalis]
MFLLSFFIFLQCCTSFLGAHPSGSSQEEVLDKWLELISPSDTNCACASGASSKDIKQLWDTLEFRDNKACLKCYVKCLFYKLCLVDSDGNVIRDEFVTKLGIRNRIYHKCCQKTDDIIDQCEKFYRFLECIFSHLGDDRIDSSLDEVVI